MDSFSMRSAWPLGFRLFGGRIGAHALILIGIGLALPLLLRFALASTLVAPPDPDSFEFQAERGMTTGAIVVALVGSVFQTGSYLASWRLGLDARASTAAAIGYGLVAGFAAVLAQFVAGAALGLSVVALGALPGFAILAGLALLVPLLALAAIFYTTLVALLAVAVGLLLVLMILFGTAMGNAGFAATLFGGGSGLIVVALIVACGVALWLASRLSCAAALMAERGSFNLIAAARDSWALTDEDQWRIMAYLALIGLGIAVAIFVLALLAGVGAANFFAPGSASQASATAFIVLGLAAGVPVAILSVAIPAGIYRTLSRSMEAVAVFA
jgi:hypothetical protein